MAGNGNVVLFDGVCALCNRSVQWLLDRDRGGRLRFASLQGETARTVLGRHPGADRTLGTVIYVRDLGGEGERLYERSDAALAILQDLGGLWSRAAWLRLLPRRLRDAVYDFIAARRYRWFGKLDACPVPDAATRDRFLT